MAAKASRLAALELAKSRLPPGDSRVAELHEATEELVDDILTTSEVQDELVSDSGVRPQGTSRRSRPVQ
jgi:hypothetical protein